MTVSLNVNGASQELDVPSDMPLLWALREAAGLTGTKYGCGIGMCGACTVLIDGAAERSCLVPVGDIGTRAVTTIEGVGRDGAHPVQQAWAEHGVPQCGYCQPGFIMQVIDLLTNTPSLSDPELLGAITNICRCGTYPQMKEAIAEARKRMPRA